MNIASYRLHNQRLIQTDLASTVDVVHWQGAVQAQDYAGAKWGIGLRTIGLHDSDVERAFTDGSILRTHLLRPTWHFVTPADIRWMLKLTAPRVHAVNAFMYRKLEVDGPTLKKSYAVFEKSLRDKNYLTRTELVSALANAGIQAETQRLAYIVMSAELDGLLCSGPRKGKQFTYALLEERVPKAAEWTREEALAELVKRYFQARGPATLQDFCVWSGLTLADAKPGMEMVKSQFEQVNVDGRELWLGKTKSTLRKDSPTAHLLPNYDEYFIGFKDRGAILKFIRETKIHQDDPALLSNVVILDGQVVGGWKRTLKKNEVLVEASLIPGLAKTGLQAIETAAMQYGLFLELPVSYLYKEYNHEQRTSRSF